MRDGCLMGEHVNECLGLPQGQARVLTHSSGFGFISTMIEIYFVRHGQTEWNAIRRWQGQMNSDLSPLGREQARANGEFLAGAAIEALYVSPLTRTRQTAEIINEHLSLEPRFDERIMEWDCGDWSGLHYEDVKATPEWDELQANRFHYRGPNCENYPDMIARARPFLDELLAGRERTIAVVSHGMIGRLMVSQLLGHGEAEHFGCRQPNELVYRVSVSGPVREVSHFVSGDGPHPGLLA